MKMGCVKMRRGTVYVWYLEVVCKALEGFESETKKVEELIKN